MFPKPSTQRMRGEELSRLRRGSVAGSFFFQAEDGIRDVAVTGVQTCALPISSTIPTQCTDTATAVTLTPTPSVTAFAPDFAAPRARRASLALLHRFGSSNY